MDRSFYRAFDQAKRALRRPVRELRDRQIAADYDVGLSSRELEIKWNLSIARICRIAVFEQGARSRRPGLTPRQYKAAKALYLRGMSLRRAVGVVSNTVAMDTLRRALIRDGIKLRSKQEAAQARSRVHGHSAS